MEKISNFLVCTADFAVYLVGATITGFHSAYSSANANRVMLHSHGSAVFGSAVGGICHFMIKLWIAAKFFDWYIYE